jgi:alkylation response protein AidB-like acyl-CoA dehydrogenase
MAGEHVLVLSGYPDAARSAQARVPVIDDSGPVLTLSGQAMFVPCASGADSVVVGARSAAGPVLALVSPRRSGVVLSAHDELSRDELHLADFAGTPVDAILCGHEDSHYGELLARLRLRQAGYLLGVAQRAFDLTLAHARRRRQFGRPIATFQDLSFRLASMAASLAGARELIGHCAASYDQGSAGGPLPGPVLAHAADLAQHVTAEALQIHGAGGLIDQTEVSRCYRYAATAGLALGRPRQLRQEAIGDIAARIAAGAARASLD